MELELSAVRVKDPAAVSLSLIVIGIVPVDVFALIVRSEMSVITGTSLTAETVTEKLRDAVAEPSLTVTVTVPLPD